MPLSFADLLLAKGIDPKSVRLLRHLNETGRTPHTAWHTDRPAFEAWQALQTNGQSQRANFASPIWASFVATPAGGTLFVGLYRNLSREAAPSEIPDHLRGGMVDGTDYDRYLLAPLATLEDLAGRLHIHWPVGRNWRRLATGTGYDVIEIRPPGQSPPYPGHAAFLQPLSAVPALPAEWQAILRTARGIYSLTCPRDRAHYVGKADGADGFLGRWLNHAAAGGDAIGFRGRSPSDYLVGILEVAGSFATARDLDEMESRWKQKLQSRSIGINRN